MDEGHQTEQRQADVHVKRVSIQEALHHGKAGILHQGEERRQGHDHTVQLPKVARWKRHADEGRVAAVEEGAVDDLQDEGEVLQRQEGDGGAEREQQALQRRQEEGEDGGLQVGVLLTLPRRPRFALVPVHDQPVPGSAEHAAQLGDGEGVDVLADQ